MDYNLKPILFAIYFSLILIPNLGLAQSFIQTYYLPDISINDIVEDTDGIMWIGTKRGLSNYNGSYYCHYTNSEKDSTSLKNDFVNSICVDKKQRIWVGTNGGINLFLHEKGFKREISSSSYKPVYYVADLDTINLLVSTHDGISLFDKTQMKRTTQYIDPKLSRSNHILYSKNKNLWILSRYEKDIEVLNRDLKHLKSIPTPQKFRSLIEDDNNQIWARSDNGLFLINAETFKLETLPTYISNLTNNKSIYLLQYEKGYLFIGISGKGIIKCNLKNKKVINPEYPLNAASYSKGIIDSKEGVWLIKNNDGFEYVPQNNSNFDCPSPIRKYVENKMIDFVFGDKSGNIWINNDKHSLIRYNPKDKQATLFNVENHVTSSVSFVSSNGHLYIENANFLYEYLILGNKLSLVRSIPQKRRILSITENDKGEIWFVRADSVFYLDKMGNINTVNTPQQEEFFKGYYFDGSKRMYFLTLNNGIYYLTEDNKFEHLFSPTKYPILNCKYFYEDSDGDFWIGTISNGLYYYNPNEDTLKHYYKENGLADNSIKKIMEGDANGIIVASTSNGLSFIYKKSNQIINHFRGDDNFTNQYSDNSGYTDNFGYIYMGGMGGLIRFKTSEIHPIHKEIPLYIDNISVNNKAIGFVNVKNMFNSLTIPTKKEIIFPYKENNLTFTFSGIDYKNGKNLKYSYYLKGLDNNWFTTSSQSVNYSSLPKGDYQFLVSVSNSGGEWGKPRSFSFTINPAPWLSPLAWSFYIIASLSLVLFIAYLIIRWRVNRATLHLVEQEKIMNERLNEMKINFFVNISHEFRTPLTLITSPLHQAREVIPFTKKTDFLFNIIDRNIQKMLRLTDQLLEYKGKKDNSLELHRNSNDLVTFISETIEIFQYSANRKKINISLVGEQTLVCSFDKGKLNDILSNLLSNAIKYSTREKNILVTVLLINSDKAKNLHPHLEIFNSSQFIEIAVKDNGIGIPDNQKEEIFSRYHRIDEVSEQLNVSGFGIGLNYTKQLIEVHGGSIKVTSNVPQGSIFSFVIPFEREITQSLVSPLDTVINSNSPIKKAPTFNLKSKKIIIVEDDIDLNTYLEKSLSEHYNVFTTMNGKECLELLPDITADLIISDWMMPIMSGDILCRNIKESIEWSTVPIILLTAKTSKDTQIQGLNLGADAYITKPFDLNYLIATINNLLINRERIQNKILNMTSLEKEDTTLSDKITLPPNDREFLEKLYKLMDQHLTEKEFNVNSIIKDLLISKTTFYNKIKNLTGNNPISFYNTYRMNKALEYLNTKRYNFSEIAEMTGFSSLASFSRAFKKHFGISPSKYKS